ncbi:protein MODIFIER OF SNC1 1 isoform X2 [Manihot esculenta]|uniref:protein MODIFIER OF SNC1 1 isoform X2 n=1 Tax=Manihot esculenta TaxID=3983 RepID=UPI001CC58AF5|nr:protein MODIFIER OF SNC1 1 isoform X2 [Manihot esculenta]
MIGCRWAPGRRSGMTVLGKVAVPKPINLPSQRLENHGLDPNVEIVPKGTHSWGSRSSSSASNAWGSCSLSLNNDGGTGSPSHLSGRPSSGGSGTRPSTAGSEKAHEPIVSAWGTNSRPSSSSGALPSNQTSHAALRPRSAETRPGSSQLSRFAEPLSDKSVAWHAMGAADKLGVTSSKNDGFSLTSGDFPSLGSEKDNSGREVDSQDHDSYSRPGSSSAGVASRNEGTEDSAGDLSAHENVKSGAESPWRRENVYGEDGARANVEKWNADFQPYPNSSIPPQHYDAWRGPPVNNQPGGVWVRGPPGCPPFRSPVAPGGFPMEPFPYYHPQIPPPALANPQAVPPPGAGPRAPHPKNGDMYRPHMHDTYMHPNIPLRPSFYPGPGPYEGYYGPPMPYCNPNERDVPFMGMAMGPATYNRYCGQSIPDPGNSHGRTSGCGPSSKAMVLDQVEPAHPQDVKRPYKVLLKQHDGWEGKDEEQKSVDTMKTNASYPLKGEHTSKSSSGENGWRADSKKDHEFDARRIAPAEEAFSGAVDNQKVVPTKVKSPESGGKLNAFEDISVKKFEPAPSSFPQELAVPKDSKDSSLIQKIEGLNAKTRTSDGRNDTKPVSSREEQNNKLQAGNAFAGHSTNEAGIDTPSHEKTSVGRIINSAPQEDCFSAGDRNLESTIVSGTTIPRRSTQGMHSRADHRGKGRFSTQEADGWRKKSQVADQRCIVSTAHYEISSVHGQAHSSVEAPQNSVLHPSLKDDGESMPPASEPSDSQRAKMRELAKRIKQREKEEEERTREQRAKALAKLEELNRRTQAGEVATQKFENVPASAIQNRQEESLNLSQQTIVASKSGAPSSSFVSETNTVAQSREKLETLPSSVVQNMHEKATTAVVSGKSIRSRSALGSKVVTSEINRNAAEKSVSIAINIPVATSKVVNHESVVVHEQLNPFQPDSNSADATCCSGTSEVHDSSAKQKRTGYRQKQISPLERNSIEKLVSSFGTEASKGHTDIAANATLCPQDVTVEIDSNCESNLPSIAAESSVHHRRKNKNGKNKQKVEEASSAAALPSVVAKDATTSEPKSSNSLLDPSSGRFPTDSNDANESSELHLSLANEETHIRVNNQWRSQHPRRMMRNKSAEKSHNGDAVVWAPVRSQHRTEVSDASNQYILVDSVLSTKNVQQVQNNPRNKRAEMERYIPKHVAKELSQQGAKELSQQGGHHQAAVPSSNQITSDETAERPKSGSLGIGSSQISGTATVIFSPSVESRNGDVRQNKSGKVHGAWRQQGAPESATSNQSRSFQKAIEDHQCQIADVSSLKEQPRVSDGWNACDGWDMPENPDTAITVPVLKEQGVTARVKRQPHKGHKGTGYNHNPDEKRTRGDADKMHIQSVAPEMHQRDSLLAAKENNSTGERSTSHWQPKSQSVSATSQQGRQTNSSASGGSEGGRVIKESTRHGDPLLPHPDKDTAAVRPQSHHDQLPSKKNLEESTTIGQEPKRERKMTAQGGRPGSPFESSSHNMDVRHEKHMSSGFRKNGNQSSRFIRNHEFRGDKSGSVKDSKQHNVPAAREGQKHNSHYEYQPVGLHNSNKANNLEPSKDISHDFSGTGYRERGQSHSRHGAGNFYGRQTRNVQVDAGHD